MTQPTVMEGVLVLLAVALLLAAMMAASVGRKRRMARLLSAVFAGLAAVALGVFAMLVGR